MKLLTAILGLLLLAIFARSMWASFRSQSPSDYAGTTPAFDLRQHLNGPIQSEGVIYGPKGRVTNSFVADMEGEWDGNTGRLREAFTYSNGQQQLREWHLTLGPDNTFTGTADDIVGVATGTVSGSTVQMSYKIILPEASGGHVLSVTDWLYLTESGAIMNRSELRKYGIKVAELLATMRPAE
ncbi:DUF3833 family protein [Epibacterium sp. SM1979]|uniref:DUF3833 family protein n=1 Tax=Tritonibacter litoralis TaxID=2662264 RepID=A0A843YKD1_9RHOB|nr:DUF3833 domain-containing protein [Tritonibacter litoralis]MQQ09629.1 DUF3833 family protein [Tritonibacter litoralis]